jgi:mycothiol synthase
VTVAEVEDLSARQVFDVLELRNAVAASGISPLSDQAVAAVKGQAPGRHFLQTTDAGLVGYAYLEPGDDPATELVVGDGGDAAEILDEVTRAAGSSLRIWTRGDRAAMNEVLPSQGFVLVRTLLQLRCQLGATMLAEPAWADGVTVRTFEVGADETAWLAVNNAAFAGHPEQSNWTLDDIRAREDEAWFDAGGFFLAEAGNRIVGFHWTKVHADRPGTELGEVYVIGVDPSMQGKGLGEALLLQGLRQLRDRGLATVLLYVEADNRGAIALYERHGFTKWDSDRMYRKTG